MHPLIFDRTAQDEEYAFANQHLPNLKGAYNASDLNRVGEWLNYLAGKMNALGYSVNISAKTDWAIGNVPTVDDLENYLNSIRQIRNWFLLPQSTPSVLTNIANLNYNSANDIERILDEANDLILRIQATFKPLGEIQLGVGI